MKYINIKLKSFLYLLVSIFLTTSCESFNEASNVSEVKLVEVTVKVTSSVPGIESLNGLSIVLEDIKYGTKKEAVLTDNTISIKEVAAGNHNVKITGKLVAPNGDIYLMSIKGSGNNNFFLSKEKELLELEVTGLRENALIFKEIFFAGTTPFYFRNQFYEIYNNSPDQVMYLDGACFANLTPVTATTKLPLWPEEDGDKYAYAERIWKFPGNGTDYPLQPGESCVISQFAANHKLPQYNPDSPVDGSSSEFEFNMDNPNFPDQPAIDMIHIFYNGQSVKGSIPQYLTSVFGGAYVLFRPFPGDNYDPVNDTSMSSTDLSSTSTQLYAKIPIEYVLDAVEAGHNETMLTAKRVPAVLDAGMTYVGATYNSLGVARKKIGENADGTPILQDTNNSTDDFDREVVPQFRRYNSKMPGWNHTLTGN
jgi:hypothetical protein